MRFLLLLLPLLATSCYRMPTEDDDCLIPATNNPRVTCEKQAANPLMPQGKY
ncbi:MAG: hypothetical protein ACK4HV_00260 [Parachlamydiaceae bacterium]